MRRRNPPREGEGGMILVNVLMFVAIASGVVMLMIGGEDVALQRATRMREAERAQAAAHGAELAAVTALRRDAVTAPDTDNGSEPWARLAERDAPIEGGRFDFAIGDAQGRFNINALKSGNAEPVVLLRRITDALELPPELAIRATELVRLYGPLSDLKPLEQAGLDPATTVRLSGLITALPYNTDVNLNAASEELLAILLADPVAAGNLVKLRERRGYLTAEDFTLLGVSIPRGCGLTSNLFWTRARVSIGDTRQQLTSLIARRKDAAGQPEVVVISRRYRDAGS